MKRVILGLMASLLIAAPVSAQQLVAPVGKNNSNAQAPGNPQCHELDINGLTYSASNPVPVQISQGNSAVATSNSLQCQLTNGAAALNGAAATAANAIPVCAGNSTISTYGYSSGYFTPVATATDMLGVVGSASKTVKIQKITLSGTQTTAGINKFFLIARSAADTGSTPAAVSAVPFDSGNAAASATVQKYTATNPTLGTAVGTIASPSFPAPAPASNAGASFVLFDSKITGQPIVLRGVAQELDLNFAGAAIPSGLSINVDIQTTEE